MTPCTDYFFIAIVLINVTNLPYLSIEIEWYNMMKILGCGCDSVGKAVASNSRGPQFESSHQKTFILNIYLLSTVLKRRKKKSKRGQEWPIKKCYIKATVKS